MKANRPITDAEKLMLNRTVADKRKTALLAEKISVAGKFNFEDNSGLFPLSNGNAVQINEIINLYAKNDTETYRWFILQAKYFTMLYGVKNCPKLETVWKSVMNTLFFYGVCATKKMGDDYMPLGVITEELDINQNVVKGSGWVNNVSFLGATRKIGKLIKFGNEDTTFWKSGYQGISGVWYWLPICKNFSRMFQSFRTNLYLNTKKFKYISRNNDSAQLTADMATFFSYNNGIIVENRGMNAKMNNKFETIDLPSNPNQSIIEELKSYMSIIYKHNGRDVNTNIKNARINSSEVSGEVVSLEIARLDFKTELILGLERFNKKFGEKAELVDYSKEIREERAKEESLKIAQQQKQEEKGDKK